MGWISFKLYKFSLSKLCFVLVFLNSYVSVCAQDSSYSPKAQEFLETYSGDNLDVFKFSINNILNSVGDTVNNTDGVPTIFGRTDYGSEFFLENELKTTSSIEIPAFVIDDLAENTSGNYFPIIKNGAINLLIDFKDLYDTKDGLAITPEMGFVKLLEPADSGQYTNLIKGDVIEFFVDPSDEYKNNHNSSDLFFIDRPIPANPVVAIPDKDETEYGTPTDTAPTEPGPTIYVGPGETAITSTNGEIKVYVTTDYVQAPASKFLPSQIVMPVNSDGDFNYDIEPAPAETFSDEIQVVAIPEKKAEELSEKVKQLKKEKESSKNPKHDEDNPPPLDPVIEAMIKLEILLRKVQQSRKKLLSETARNIKKEFPNMSNELINFIINASNSDEKYALIRDPKEILDKEFSNLSNPSNLNIILSRDLPREELKKIYNLIMYKFSADLAELGFQTLKNREFSFSNKVLDPDQILDQVQLQKDIIPIASLLGSYNEDQNLSNLLIDPIEVDPESSTALFHSNQSKRILSQIKSFSKVINSINNLPRTIPATQGLRESDIPVIELNVGVGENIAEALNEKLAEDKRLNRAFQPRSQSSKLEQFSFDIARQNESSTPSVSPPLLADIPNITEQEIQLVRETTEAANNILDQTVAKMLKELGEEPSDENTAQLVAETNNMSPTEQQEPEKSETVVFSNALSTVQRLQEIEDIRAIFQILGLGS